MTYPLFHLRDIRVETANFESNSMLEALVQLLFPLYPNDRSLDGILVKQTRRLL